MPGVKVTTNFFLVLTLVADAVVVVALVLAIAALVSPRARAAVVSFAAAVAPQSVLLAWIVAMVTTLGSLYYSEHAGFVPCELCWYQRIVMYPLVIVLGVGWLRTRRAGLEDGARVRGDRRAAVAVPLVGRAGAGFAESSSCSVTVPCTAPYFEKLGFVTLAWMAMSSFLLIGVLMLCTVVGSRTYQRRGTGRYGGCVSTKAQRRAGGDRPTQAAPRTRRSARPAAQPPRALGRAGGRGRRVAIIVAVVASGGGDDSSAKATSFETHAVTVDGTPLPSYDSTKSPDPGDRQDHPHAGRRVGAGRETGHREADR